VAADDATRSSAVREAVDAQRLAGIRAARRRRVEACDGTRDAVLFEDAGCTVVTERLRHGAEGVGVEKSSALA
jgi:hypothetical protein